MATNFPQRHPAHQLEAESIRHFRRCLPAAWTCDEPENDYGVDLRIGLVTGNQVDARTLVVQLKASASAPLGETVAVRLAVATYNYLMNMLEVAMLVKYVAAENEAYWLLLRDSPPPPEDQETFTVRIPRTNRLSQNPWLKIEAHVGHVHHKKLDAMRK